ncbi:hypothetical protein ACWGDX_01555 [Streptomyces sp. NPDC055025]
MSHSTSPFTGSAPRTQEWRHLRPTRDVDGDATVTLDRRMAAGSGGRRWEHAVAVLP